MTLNLTTKMLLQMISSISVAKQTNKQTEVIYIKIKFQNSIERLSFLYHIMDIKISWINQ